MTDSQLEHEVSVSSPYAQDTHNARCVCGWTGKLRSTEMTAWIDAKQHRLDTVEHDDTNRKRKAAKK